MTLEFKHTICIVYVRVYETIIIFSTLNFKFFNKNIFRKLFRLKRNLRLVRRRKVLAPTLMRVVIVIVKLRTRRRSSSNLRSLTRRTRRTAMRTTQLKTLTSPALLNVRTRPLRRAVSVHWILVPGPIYRPPALHTVYHRVPYPALGSSMSLNSLDPSPLNPQLGNTILINILII